MDGISDNPQFMCKVPQSLDLHYLELIPFDLAAKDPPSWTRIYIVQLGGLEDGIFYLPIIGEKALMIVFFSVTFLVA